MHDYFYGREAEQFTFYRVPTVLFTDDQYRGLSPEAKILYGILLKRMELSARNSWLDEKGRVYIIFTLKEIMNKMNCADNKATRMMDELENGYGLIERKRQGLGKPNLIYVKNFINSDKDTSESRFLIRENNDSGALKTANHESLKARAIDREDRYTDERNTDPIYPKMDGKGSRAVMERYFKEAVEYDALLVDFPGEKETIDGIIELLVDACTLNRETIRIAGDDRPREVVRSRLMKINGSCVRYVLSCLRENCSDVKNIKQYLLSALYNAPTTIGPYYQSKVNHSFGAVSASFGKTEERRAERNDR